MGPWRLLDAMTVNAAFQSALSNYIGAEYRKLWSGVRFRIMDDPIWFRIEGNLNSNRYVREMQAPDIVAFFQCIPEAIFQKDNAHPHFERPFHAFFFWKSIDLLFLSVC